MDESQSSLPYQILLSLSKWFLPSLVTVQVLVFLFKCLTLPYPPGNIASEALLLALYIIIEWGRISSGERGNLTERPLFVLVSLGLSGPACTVLVYWLIWQTYVLRVEGVLAAVALTMQAAQALLALLLLLAFTRTPS